MIMSEVFFSSKQQLVRAFPVSLDWPTIARPRGKQTSEYFFFFFFLFFNEDLESDAYVWLIDWLIDFGGVGSSFLREGFLQLRRAGATLHRGARASLVAEHRLQTRRLSSCGSRAQPLRGMWDPPRPGLEPASPALAGRFSTTAPPGKPQTSEYYKKEADSQIQRTD